MTADLVQARHGLRLLQRQSSEEIISSAALRREGSPFTGLVGKGKGRPGEPGRPCSETSVGVGSAVGWLAESLPRLRRPSLGEPYSNCGLFLIVLRTADQQLFCDYGLSAANSLLNVGGDIRIGFQEIADIVSALTNSLAGVGEPGT